MVGPGVSVTTAVQSGSASALRAPSSRLFIAGLAERGSTTGAVLLRGMADYEALFGARVTYGALYDQLKTYFGEGGVEAYVTRVVGGAATLGTLTLSDRAGAPLNTLRVDAANPGAWSSRLTVEVRDGSLPNSFRIIVRLDGDIVEDKTNLLSPSAAQVQFANSSYVRVTNLGSATAEPNNNPAVAAEAALSAGTDDRAAVVANDYVTALDRFTPGLGDGAVALPGIGQSVHTGLIAHAKAHRRVALLAGDLNDTVANLQAKVDAITADGEYAGLFAPWINVSDDAGGFRQISPEGYVAAARARAHEQVGPWRAPAGRIAVSNSILGLAQTFTTDEAATLDAARVSVIRVIANSVRLYGWRSLSSDEENFKYLSARDMLNRLVVEGEDALEEFVYAPIDDKGQLLSSVNASLVGIAEAKRQAGGLYGRTNPTTGQLVDPGYSVDTGPGVNSQASLANNEVKARLAVRVAPTGALVSLTIVKVGVLSGL